MRPARLFAFALAGASVLAAALVTASLLGSRDPEASKAPAAATGVSETSRLLDGIPQDGAVLGSPDAPVTLVEYADLQCPYCAAWALDALPTLVDDYVRTGRVRIVFRGLAFIGRESDLALRTALAAGRQDRMWHVLEGLYRNQGAENAGWVTDELLRTIGEAAPGLDVERALEERFSTPVSAQMARAAAAAESAGVTGTPSFELGPTGGPLERLAVDSLDAATFAAALDTQLAR
jgi:protein-disulfide isomerase